MTKKRLGSLLSKTLTYSLSALLFIGTVDLPLKSQPVTHVKPRYSGEDIFRGVFFGDGPLAGTFPEIWDSPMLAAYRNKQAHTQSLSLRDRYTQNTIAALRTTDPQFFITFADAMQSGNRLRISNSLVETSKRLAGLHQSPYLSAQLDVVIGIEVISVVEPEPEPGVVTGVAEFEFTTLASAASGDLQKDILADLIARRL
jgi:SdpC family antimicrobial peptide